LGELDRQQKRLPTTAKYNWNYDWFKL